MVIRISLQNVINTNVFMLMRLTHIRNITWPITNFPKNTNNQYNL